LPDDLRLHVDQYAAGHGRRRHIVHQPALEPARCITVTLAAAPEELREQLVHRRFAAAGSRASSRASGSRASSAATSRASRRLSRQGREQLVTQLVTTLSEL
jgi:hypothetical protein